MTPREALLKAEVIQKPFPHFIAEGLFEESLYQQILKNLPESTKNKSTNDLKGMGSFWEEINKLFGFGDELSIKLGVTPNRYSVRLVRDPSGYSLGPHTDDPDKVFSVVCYLTEAEKTHGTSIYVPKISGFSHDGRSHLSFKDFKKVKTAPFKPNTAFGFVRSGVSFHGVEKTSEPRFTLLFNAYR